MEHNKNFVGKNLQTRAIFLNFTAIYELKKIFFFRYDNNNKAVPYFLCRMQRI